MISAFGTAFFCFVFLKQPFIRTKSSFIYARAMIVIAVSNTPEIFFGYK
ncbi:MAG: hypothetical protein LBL74_08075 [Bacteroidales bacterium]|nr:hypothetical protein [Bacteroidales bacterium]